MRVLAPVLALVLATSGHAQDAGATRGQLLYEAHCIQCHTEQMHWRDARVARDWATLRAQVEAWQMRSGQRWTAEDVDAVARHLNTTIYHYPPAKEQADAGAARPVSAA